MASLCVSSATSLAAGTPLGDQFDAEDHALDPAGPTHVLN
jgi:hypothetical protein